MRGGNRFGDETISAGAAQVFRDMYLTQQQLSVRLCLRNTGYINEKEQKGWTLPSLRVMQYYVKRYIPEPVRILHREGRAAYNARCAPYNQIEPDSIEPGQVWVGDHYQFNCWVRHRNRWIRPWLTAWQDMRSRMLVGWYICPLPNQTTILVATRRAIKKHGPPDMVKIDNGKDYDSVMWSGMTKKTRKSRKVLRAGYLDEPEVMGLYGWLGIRASFAIPYNPRAKRIERLFATINSQFNSTLNTYCGEDVIRRPENLGKLLKSPDVIASAMSLDEFSELFGRYVQVYNNSVHTGDGMDGRTPAQVMETRRSRRAIDEDMIEEMLRVWSGELKIGKNGVRFKGLYYGQYNQRLQQHFGKVVIVASNPDDIRYVTVYDAHTKKRICIAKENTLIRYAQKVSEEDLREGQRQQRETVKFYKGYRSSSRKVHMGLSDLSMESAQARAKPEPKPKPKLLRPVKTFLDDQKEGLKRERAQLEQEKLKEVNEPKSEKLNIDYGKMQAMKNPPNKYDGKRLFDDEDWYEGYKITKKPGA